MHALLHSLNIGTLATWLSVAGFGTVGVIVPQWHPHSAVSMIEETRVFDDDFTLGNEGSPETPGDAPPSENAVNTPEPLPAPPELPALAESAPLPEIPDLPAAAAKPAARPETLAKPSNTESRPRTTTSRASGKPSPPAQTGVGQPAAAASGMSDSSRLAHGRMPSPSYPGEARRMNQTGTVLVEFTVDSSGRVISAHAKSPSPWPLLNNEAVRTVRRWKFPPGGVMKLQRPIVFQLR